MRIIIFLLLLVTSSTGLSGQSTNHRIKVVFRFDDYMLKHQVMFDSILYIFKKNNIPLTLGIVPYDKKDMIFNKLSQDDIDELKDRIKKNKIEIALHGFSHTDNNLSRRSIFKNEVVSEFSNMDYKEQVLKIRRGKEALDSILDINITAFIPPYNSYDSNTLKALESLNFNVISASMDGNSEPGRLSYIPYTISELTELPGLLRMVPDDNYSIIVIIHPYSFIGGVKTKLTRPVYFSKLDTLLNWINRQDNISAVSFSALAKSEEFSDLRFKTNSTDNNMFLKTLEKFSIFRFGVYHTTEYQRNHKLVYGIFNILFHVIVFLTFYFIAKLFRKLIMLNRLIKVIIILLFSLMILAGLYKAINSHALTIYVLFLTTIVVGFCTGLLIGGRRPVIVRTVN